MHPAPLIPFAAGHAGGALEAASYSRTVGLGPTLEEGVGLLWVSWDFVRWASSA